MAIISQGLTAKNAISARAKATVISTSPVLRTCLELSAR